MITEMSELLLDQGFTRSQHIPSEVNQVLALTKNSISTITTKTLLRKCTSVHQESRVKHWNDKLSEFDSPEKIHQHHRTRIPEQCLEAYPERNACWTAVISTESRIRHSPHSSKLAMLETKARCQVPSLRPPWPTVQHILNGCPVSLAQGRYTWRHDSALKILANGLREYLQPGERLYADLPGLRTTDNPPSTIPA